MLNTIIIPTDGYKVEHQKMYPAGTTKVVSNFTTRSVKYMPDEAKDIVIFGLQYTFKKIHEEFERDFFSKPLDQVLYDMKETLSIYGNSNYDISHFEALHKLGYLPIEVMGLEEGTVLKNAGIPSVVYWNTLPEFYWVTNFLETLISTTLWKPMHSASMSLGFRRNVKPYLDKTCPEAIGFLDFQNHDFSFRGMQSIESAISSGMGFSVCSKGSDTLPVLWGNSKYYNTQNSVCSVPATEHAVMTAYGKEKEEVAFSRILSLYPTGIISLVSDSYDFFKIHTDTIYKLKDQILARNGKTVFRGDSGNPADMICGHHIVEDYDEYCSELSVDIDKYARKSSVLKVGNDYYKAAICVDTEGYFTELLPMFSEGKIEESEVKGQVELLWDCFGGTISSTGYKILNEKVGVIWGDGITFKNQTDILERLEAKGFASCNIVFGIGSYSMGYATRDNQGTACKATYIEGNGEGREIYKDPKTDPGKKSAKGLLAVLKDPEGVHYLKDRCTWSEVKSCELQLIYKDGKTYNETTLDQIREQVNSNL